MRGRIRLEGDPEWLTVDVQAGEQLVVTAGGTEIGRWLSDAFTLTRTSDGFRLDVDGEQLELQVDEPDVLETAYTIGRGDLRTRFQQARRVTGTPPAAAVTPAPRTAAPAADIPTAGAGATDPLNDAPKRRRGAWLAGIVAVIVIASVCGDNSTSGGDPDTVAAAATTTTRPETTTTRAVTTTVRPVATTVPAASGSGLGADDMESLLVYYMRGWSEDKPLNFIDELTDSAIVGLAETTCGLWADGLSFESLALGMMASIEGQGWDALDDTNVEAMGTLVGAGTEALCPQYSNRLP